MTAIRASPLRRGLKRIRSAFRAAIGSYRLRHRLRAAPSIRIVIGSSGICDPGWIPTEIEFLNLLRVDDWQRHFQPGAIQAMLAEHVWEHLSPEDGLRAARTCLVYLAPGGYLRLAVPDGFHPDAAYRDAVKVGGTGSGADDHKVLYNWETLSALLSQAGFAVEPLEYFDTGGRFHFQNWDPASGMIRRSRRFDPRNQDGQLRYTSLIVDARKPPPA